MLSLHDLGKGQLSKGSTPPFAKCENSSSTPPQLKSTLGKNKRGKRALISSSQTRTEPLVWRDRPAGSKARTHSLSQQSSSKCWPHRTLHISIRKKSHITYFSVQTVSELCKSVQLGQLQVLRLCSHLCSLLQTKHTRDMVPEQILDVPELI